MFNAVSIPPRTVNVIPINWVEGYTLYETLINIGGTVTEILAYLESGEDTSKEYTDQQINLLRSEVSAQLTSINILIEATKTELVKMVDDNVVILRGEITAGDTAVVNNLTTIINREVATLNDKITTLSLSTDNKLEELNSELRAYIDSSIIDLQLLNPYTGTVEGIQDIIDDIVNNTKQAPLTAGEFDALQLTAAEFDAYMITAFDYDFKGKDILQ